MLQKKIALILGGTGNIGSAIAGVVEKSGATVCRHGLSGEFAADVSNTEELRRLIEKVIGRFGRLEILINSVSAPVAIGNFEQKNWNNFLEHLNVQLKSAVESAALVLPQMKKQKFGRIVHVVSAYTAGQPPASLSDYVTAKYALLGFTKALAKETARFGITVNAISPSLIRNEFSKGVPEKLFELLTAQSPTGRLTTAEDVARAALSLVGEEGGQVNGENFVINHGQITKQS